MSSCCSLFLITLALFVTQYSEADLLSTVCSQSPNPSLCNQVIGSDPRAKGADLVGLGLIAIEKSQTAVKAATSAVKKVPPKGNVKEAISQCVEVLSTGVGFLNMAKKYLKSGDKAGLNSAASAAATDVDVCDEGFSDLKLPEPASVSQATNKAHDLIEIIVTISTL